MKVVERATLVKEGRVGTVQIFRSIRIGFAVENASPEGNHSSARIVNRQHQTTAKPVVRFLALDGDPHSGLYEHRLVEPGESTL